MRMQRLRGNTGADARKTATLKRRASSKVGSWLNAADAARTSVHTSLSPVPELGDDGSRDSDGSYGFGTDDDDDNNSTGH